MLDHREVRREAFLLLLLATLTAVTWLVFITNRSPGTPAAARGFPLDDAWIHLVYARNLVEQGGLHYNDGVPETGMTSPLWVVLLSGIYLITGHGSAERVVIGAKVLSLTFGIGGVVMLYRLARAAGERRTIALLGAGLAAVDPSLTFARAAGMEVPLFIFLSVAALLSAVRGRLLATGLAGGLAMVARPEGVVLLPVLLCLLLRADARSQPDYARKLVLSGVCAAGPGLAYAGYCWYATGAPLPNTFYAKFAAPDASLVAALLFGWRHYVHENLTYFTLGSGYIAALLGALRWIRRQSVAGLAVIATGMLLFAAPLLSRVFAPGHYFYWERWLVPSFPFLMLGMAAGIGELYDGLPSLQSLTESVRQEQRWQSVSRLLAYGFCGLLVLPLPASLRVRSELYAWNAQNIQEMNVALGKWIDANLPPAAVVAVVDAGALHYFGRRAMYDFFGLNTHALLGGSAREKFDRLKRLQTNYVVAVPGFFSEDITRIYQLTPVHSVRAPHYTICDAPQDTLAVYRMGAPTTPGE